MAAAVGGAENEGDAVTDALGDAEAAPDCDAAALAAGDGEADSVE